MVIPAQDIKRAAQAAGFDGCGVAKAAPQPLFASYLHQWLATGCHADMHYMANNEALRSDPTLLLSQLAVEQKHIEADDEHETVVQAAPMEAACGSIISVILGYKPDHTIPGDRHISRYAYGEDYHELVKRKLYRMIELIRTDHPTFMAKPCVDTVPISDKWWAWKSGLGWIGKNSLLIHPQIGSYCFLGELVTTAQVDTYDQPLDNRCGDCRRCLDACPNQAITPIESDDSHGATRLNATRCNAYHTIENKAEQLPTQLHLTGFLFGCDRCQEACPYNEQAPVKQIISEERIQQLNQLFEADEGTFRQLTKHTALTRIQYPQWLRNKHHPR